MMMIQNKKGKKKTGKNIKNTHEMLIICAILYYRKFKIEKSSIRRVKSTITQGITERISLLARH